jgi:D-aspartate ligase
VIRRQQDLRRSTRRWRKPAAVVTNLESYVGLQTARTLRRHGIPVVALANRPNAPLCRTRSVEAIFDAGPDGAGTVRVLQELAPLFPERPVLFPCSDAAVLAVSAARGGLDYHLVLPDHETLELLTDKSRFLVHASQAGVPVSPFRLLLTRQDAEAASSALQYPVVVKPVRKNRVWDERAGQKAVRIFGRDELMALWDTAMPDYPVLAQEWVDGGDDQLFAYNGYFDRSGNPLASFVTRKIRQWPPHTGAASLGVECRNDEVLESALALFRSVPFAGFGYLEMKRDARTGRHYAIEANIGRRGGRSFIAEAGGVELMHTAYCDALGLPLPEARIQRYGDAKWIYLGKDLASAWYYHRRGELTLGEWWRSIRGPKVDAIFSWSDPLPFILDLFSGFIRVRRKRRPL